MNFVTSPPFTIPDFTKKRNTSPSSKSITPLTTTPTHSMTLFYQYLTRTIWIADLSDQAPQGASAWIQKLYASSRIDKKEKELLACCVSSSDFWYSVSVVLESCPLESLCVVCVCVFCLFSISHLSLRRASSSHSTMKRLGGFEPTFGNIRKANHLCIRE